MIAFFMNHRITAKSRAFFWLFLSAFLGIFFFDTAVAFAAVGAGSGPMTATTFGDIFCNMKMAGGGYPYILNVISYIMGAFLGVKGVLLLKKHSENPSQPQAVAGMAHLIGAGALLALPTMAGVIQQTLFGGSLGGGDSFGCGQISYGTGSGAKGLDTMMMNFVKNVYSPLTALVGMISVAVGLTFLVKGLLAGIKTGSDPRASNPKTILTYLVFGAILISIGGVLPDALKTLFGSGDVNNMNSFSILSWSGIKDIGGDKTAANNAVKAILAFIQIVGTIAFFRGFLILKAAVDGGGQATIPQGLTHVIGGAMAINIDVMLTVFDKTFGTGIIG